jgi:single-stranded-DNA-specific exonuclease
MENELSAYSPLLQQLLSLRGIATFKDAEEFLNPNYETGLADPFGIHDMERAVVRIFEAVEAKEKIVVYADYDCDGIPGAVVLHDFFKKINYENFEVYIPHRHEEGYGLNNEAITEFRDKEVKLLITVDLGITGVEEVALATGFGIDVIITDHHIPKSTGIPKAYAIVNPKLSPEYNDVMLCGAGVAFRLVQAFVKKYGEYFKIPNGWEKWLLDMAGLATLSDMVPLVKENRVLAYYGLKVLKQSRRPGLLQLLKIMKIDPRYLSEDDIGYMIAPRINAASRMDDPMRAFELLAVTDPREAGALAEHLSKINDERKTLVATIMREANHTLAEREIKPVIVIGNPKWRVGVLGLVASRLTEEYKKPAFVWGLEGSEVIKGSCRSDGSVNLVTLMTHIPAGSFAEFGGHEGAGGFAVSHEQVHFLEGHLVASYEVVRKAAAPAVAGAASDAGISITLDDINSKNYKDIEKLAPFGTGNPKPVFYLQNIMISGVKCFGKEKNHLELCFENSKGRTVKAIAFFKSFNSFNKPLERGISINLLATMELSNFAGREELRMRIVDII